MLRPKTNTFKLPAGTPQGISRTLYGDNGQHEIAYPKGTMANNVRTRRELTKQFGPVNAEFNTLTLASLKK